MSRSVALDAPAKINLVLRVLDRRPDGYRELETIFQMISLADHLAVTVAEGNGEITLNVDGPDLGPLEENLAYRAAERFLLETGVKVGVTISLTKKIPAGAGLGGGSSDAAAVLRCLAALISVTDDELLHRIAAGLGADVPFFLGPSPTALGRGRGDELTALPALPAMDLVVALPTVHVSTAGGYAALAESRGERVAGGRTVRAPHRDTVPAPHRDTVRAPHPDHFYDGLDWRGVSSIAHNDFQDVISALHEPIAASIDGLRSESAAFSLLSGSGGASFGIFPDGITARSAASALTKRLGWPFVAVKTLFGLPRMSGPIDGG